MGPGIYIRNEDLYEIFDHSKISRYTYGIYLFFVHIMHMYVCMYITMWLDLVKPFQITCLVFQEIPIQNIEATVVLLLRSYAGRFERTKRITMA